MASFCTAENKRERIGEKKENENTRSGKGFCHFSFQNDVQPVMQMTK
jgi:hypothetical protein